MYAQSFKTNDLVKGKCAAVVNGVRQELEIIGVVINGCIPQIVRAIEGDHAGLVYKLVPSSMKHHHLDRKEEKSTVEKEVENVIAEEEDDEPDGIASW